MVFEEAYRQVFGVISDRHLRDDFAAVEVDGERFFFDDREGDGLVVMVDTRERTGEGGIIRIGKEGHGASIANK